MALFDQSYNPPGVYTDVVLNSTSAPLTGNARIPVFIGEGLQTFSKTNVQLHRGSSSVADDQIVGENLSDQVDGSTRSFQLGFFPVVTGDGTGTVTSDPSYVQATADGQPVTVLSVNGATGQIVLSDIVPEGTNLVATFFFKRKDTLISNEDDSVQVPVYATLAILGGAILSVSMPGFSGNNVSFALTQASTGSGVSDSQAVSGNGSDTISIELRKTDNTVRTNAQVVALLQTSIETLSAGYLTVSGTPAAPNSAATAVSAAHLAGGVGQNTNTVFKVKHVPIVDGSNGGVVTTDASKVTAVVNGQAVAVAAVDGQHGLVTLASPVPANASLRFTYYTNTYQNTSDVLPGSNVASVQTVGLGPGRTDFIAGVDYILSGNSIAWGASVETEAAQSTAGYTPLDGTAINTTLVDEKVYLRPLQGTIDGKNTVFSLVDSPVDGSGLSAVTDDPGLITVYVGANPLAAVTAGAVQVIRLSGASGQLTLLNPPSVGSGIWATYWRSELNDHTYTLAVQTAGGTGTGTYSVTDEEGRVAQATAVSNSSTIEDANFNTTGVVWPHNLSDLSAPLGAADETITLTFQDDANTITISPATQMSVTIDDSNSVPRIQLRATTPGVISGNPWTVQLVGGPTGAADASALTLTDTAISISIVKADNVTTRTWQEVVDLFTSNPITSGTTGQILASGVTGADLTPQATATSALTFNNGVAAVTKDVATRFLVTSNRTQSQANADHLGLTGGATTGGQGTGAVGYLGQTYIDAQTGVSFTVVDPRNALNYGYQSLPSPVYYFTPGDTLVFTVSAANLPVGKTVNNVPGLELEVVTTTGMHVGDTATVETFNKSGNQPNVGEYYYVNYTTNKATSDFALQTFSKASDAYNQYGQPNTPNNRLSLAISMFVQNGGQQFACVQVPVVAGTPYASDASFLDAITGLASGLGSGQFADVFIPLSTSATVQQAMSRFLITQSAPQIKNRAIAFLGNARFATALQIQALAQSLANERVILSNISAMGVSFPTPNNLGTVEMAVSGEFSAAQLAGAYCNPSNDVATTLTGQKLVGATRDLNPLDPPTMNQLAAAGVTVLTNVSGALKVRHYKTTDPSSALTSEPYVVTTTDYVAAAMETGLGQFQGRKMTSDLPSSIAAVGNALLGGWMNDLITAYTPLQVVQDPNDPTTYNVSYGFRPMFSLLYQNVTMQVNLA